VTLRPEVVRERLRKLRSALRNLEDICRVEKKEFLSDYRHQWLAERGLLLAAEAVLDCGNHILAGAFNLHPADYEDVIAKLGEQGVIPDEMRERLRGLGGFRNVLVHGYLDVDRGRGYEYLTTRLGDFTSYADSIEAFLGD
jgi:uncharacterized protein YutE (UPF0331/DUF86 family)